MGGRGGRLSSEFSSSHCCRRLTERRAQWPGGTRRRRRGRRATGEADTCVGGVVGSGGQEVAGGAPTHDTGAAYTRCCWRRGQEEAEVYKRLRLHVHLCRRAYGLPASTSVLQLPTVGIGSAAPWRQRSLQGHK